MTHSDLWRGTEPDAREFSRRHIGPDAAETEAMLREIGAPDLDTLIAQTVPASILEDVASDLPPGLTETEVLERLRAIAGENQVLTSLIGQGYHGTILPPVIQRNILENPAWYTAYTPYQPEISQGRLEALLNFQTLVCDLTGLDVANASLLDEATAAGGAMALARRVSHAKVQGFFVDHDTHPQTLAVLRTRAEPLGWTLIVGDPSSDLDASAVFGALLSYPGSGGAVRDHRDAIGRLHQAGAIVAMAADPLALTLLTPPGALGADIAIGSMQRFGVPMGYGGPHAAYMRCATPASGRSPAGWSACRSTAMASPRFAWRCRPRAAYPAREGDLEHLHRPGAAGSDRRDVCGLSRACRAARDRAAHAPTDHDPRRRAARAGCVRPPHGVLRYADRGCRRGCGPRARTRARARHQSAPLSRRPADRHQPR